MDTLIIARTIAAATTIVLGSCLQLLFWKDEKKSTLEAIFSAPFLWVLYVFIGLLVGEHVFRLLSIKHDEAKEERGDD